MPHKWLGRAPRNAEEVKRMQSCCESDIQCSNCPLLPKNRSRSLHDILREGIDGR